MFGASRVLKGTIQFAIVGYYKSASALQEREIHLLFKQAFFSLLIIAKVSNRASFALCLLTNVCGKMRVNVQQQLPQGSSLQYDHLLLGARLVIFTLSTLPCLYLAVSQLREVQYPADFYKLSTFGQMRRQNTIGITTLIFSLHYMNHIISRKFEPKLRGFFFQSFQWYLWYLLHKRIT